MTYVNFLLRCPVYGSQLGWNKQIFAYQHPGSYQRIISLRLLVTSSLPELIQHWRWNPTWWFPKQIPLLQVSPFAGSLLKFSLDDKTEKRVWNWAVGENFPKTSRPSVYEELSFPTKPLLWISAEGTIEPKLSKQNRNKCLQKELKQRLFTNHLLDLSNVTFSTG